MAKFSINRHHTMSIEDIRKAAEKLAQELNAEYGLKYSWRGDTAYFSRSGIDGTLSIDENAVNLTIKLDMLAAVFERPLKRAVNNYLDKYVS